MLLNQKLSFRIKDYLGSLQESPLKEKNKYICPACGGHNLSIQPAENNEHWKYKCWNGCLPQEIREAISPWKEALSKAYGTRIGYLLQPEIPKQLKTTIKLSNSKKDTIHPAGSPHFSRSNGKEIEANLTTYHYSDTQWVEVYRWGDEGSKKGRSKNVRPYHKTTNGIISGKGEEAWPLYREKEVVRYKGTWIFLPEGEASVEAFRWIGMTATTFFGGTWGEKDIEEGLTRLKDSGIGGLILMPDNDATGEKKMSLVADVAARVGISTITIPSEELGLLPAGGDIVDFVKIHYNGSSKLLGKEDIKKHIEKIVQKQVKLEQSTRPTECRAEDKQLWLQKAMIMIDKLSSMPDGEEKTKLAQELDDQLALVDGLSSVTKDGKGTLKHHPAFTGQLKPLYSAVRDAQRKRQYRSLLDLASECPNAREIMSLKHPMQNVGWESLSKEIYKQSIIQSILSLQEDFLQTGDAATLAQIVEYNEIFFECGLVGGLTTETQRIKEDVLAYLEIFDRVEQLGVQRRLKARYGWSDKEFEAYLSACKYEQENRRPVIRKLTDIIAEQSQVGEHLYSGIIPANAATMIAGDPGSGKSTLACDLQASYLNGTEFLGQPVNPQAIEERKGVLYVNADQSDGELAATIEANPSMADVSVKERVGVYSEWRTTFMMDLEAAMRSGEYGLIILDSYAAIHKGVEGYDENSANAGDFAGWFNEKCAKYKQTGVIIHHAAKDKSKKGLEKIRGSSSITAAPSAVVILSKDETNPQYKNIEVVKIRNAPESSYVAKFDASTMHHELVKESSKGTPVSNDEVNGVLSQIRRLGTATTADIEKLFPRSDRAVVARAALQKLQQRGQVNVEKADDGKPMYSPKIHAIAS